MKMLFFFIWTFFLFTPHPMMKIAALVINMLLILYLISYFMKSYWIIMIFSLLVISGLMVIFIYFTSLKPLSSKTKDSSHFLMMTLFILVLLNLSNNNMVYNFNTFTPLFISMNLYKNINNGILMSLMMVYIVMTLLWNIEIISNMKSSFRSSM